MAGLVPDLQRVREAARDQQGGARALAFEERVGCDGRAHANVAGRNGRVGFERQQSADPHERGQGTREDLGHMKCIAPGVETDAVREGTGAVDPQQLA